MIMRMSHIRVNMLRLSIILGCLIFPLNAFPANLSGVVQDTGGKPVKDAVVYLNVVAGDTPSQKRPYDAVMDQQHREFVPYVLPVQVGTAVHFPNKDNIRHHIYSISPAKKFELPLYEGTPASPVVFDKPGVVVLGCNIHDWMVAYVYVLKTPYFVTTGKDGSAVLHDLPPGTYEVRVWHPLLKDSTESTGRQVNLFAKEANVNFVISLKPDWRPLRMPSMDGGSYH